MSVFMDTNFINWLFAQMQERNWSQADLAKASGINKETIYYYLNLSPKPPHAHALAKIAYALELPVEQVYQAAGYRPHPPEINETIEQIVYELEDMSEEDQKEVLTSLRVKNHMRRELKKK